MVPLPLLATAAMTAPVTTVNTVAVTTIAVFVEIPPPVATAPVEEPPAVAGSWAKLAEDRTNRKIEHHAILFIAFLPFENA